MGRRFADVRSGSGRVVLEPCPGMPPTCSHHDEYEPHPDSADLLELVTYLLQHGKSPAGVIATLLETYGEDPPAQSIEALQPEIDDGHAEAIHRALLRLKRRRGHRSLGLA